MRRERIVPYRETHQQGNVSIEKVVAPADVTGRTDLDFGIQVASDGRVWICIDGEAWIRFKPHVQEWDDVDS